MRAAYNPSVCTRLWNRRSQCLYSRIVVGLWLRACVLIVKVARFLARTTEQVDANVASQSEPPRDRRRDAAGTILCAGLDFNVRARNGEWVCFTLLGAPSGGQRPVAAWFCCHSDWAVEAEGECKRILKHAGSPYEADSGDSFNTDRTRAAGVLVINRYDWSWTDTRGLADGANAQEGIGLADHGAAGHGATSSAWEASGDGAMLPCEGEYEFGRFGYNLQTGESYSFLYFRAGTAFTHTGFRGRSPLHVELTHAERYTQRLANRHDGGFSGFHALQSRLDSDTLRPSTVPPQRWEGKLLGPFRRRVDTARDDDEEDTDPQQSDGGEHVLHVIDLDAMRSLATELQFEPSLIEETLALMDELWMAWLAGHGVETLADLPCINQSARDGQEGEPTTTGSTFEPELVEEAVQQPIFNAGAQLFPKHGAMCLDKLAYDAMVSSVLAVDDSARRTALSRRVQAFVSKRGISLPLARTGADPTLPSAQEICAALEALSRELLELGSNHARDTHREFLCPCDLRLPVAMFDPELENAFGRARALWVLDPSTS